MKPFIVTGNLPIYEGGTNPGFYDSNSKLSFTIFGKFNAGTNLIELSFRKSKKIFVYEKEIEEITLKLDLSALTILKKSIELLPNFVYSQPGGMIFLQNTVGENNLENQTTCYLTPDPNQIIFQVLVNGSYSPFIITGPFQIAYFIEYINNLYDMYKQLYIQNEYNKVSNPIPPVADNGSVVAPAAPVTNTFNTAPESNTNLAPGGNLPSKPGGNVPGVPGIPVCEN